MEGRPDHAKVRHRVLTGRWVDDVRLDTRLEPADELDHSLREPREGRVAGGVRGAARDDEVERGLAVGRDPLQDRHVDRGRAVQDRHADVVGMLAEVVLRERPAIRRPIEIDLVIPEGRPDVIEVVRRDRARVEPRVGIECGQAVAHPCRQSRIGLGCRQPGRVGHRRERQGVRRAGAALVDEHDVARRMDALVMTREPREERRARVAGAAGDGEEGVRFGDRGERRDDRDPETEVATIGGRPVFGHREVPHRPATSAFTGISPWTRHGVKACPASMREVDATGLAADPGPRGRRRTGDEQRGEDQDRDRTRDVPHLQPLYAGAGEMHVRVTPSCGLATHRTCKVVPMADLGQESHDPVGVGRAMRSRSSRWARAVVLWTVALLLVSIALAVVAVVSLYDAQQACFFDTTVQCPNGGDWRVALLTFALVGVPGIWVAGMIVAFAVRRARTPPPSRP